MKKEDITNMLIKCSQHLTNLYDGLIENTGDVQSAEQSFVAAKTAYEEAKSKILVEFAENAKALGSNEATREATINSMLSAHVLNVKQAQESLQTAKDTLALASIKLESWKRTASIWQSIALLAE